MIRSVLREITPPVFRRLLRGGDEPSSTTLAAPTRIPQGGPKALNHLIGKPAFEVPVERVRYPDGRRYVTSEHHFMQYYAEGLPALRRFYELHVPKTIFEMYFLDTPGRGAPSVNETPWLRRVTPFIYRGECGLGPEHGRQDFGPVSEEKIQLEAKRLDEVRTSIEERGFVPELGGYVQGYFMIDAAGDWVFTVSGGFHRTAAVAHLGFAALPACFDPNLPRFVEEADAALWPLVADGTLREADARAMFGQFFRSPIFVLPS